MDYFLGKPYAYWTELSRKVDQNAGNIPAYTALILENAKLRAIVHRYELAIKEVADLKENL